MAQFITSTLKFGCVHALVHELEEFIRRHVVCLRVTGPEQMFSADRASRTFGAPQPHHAIVACVLYVCDTQRSKLSASVKADHTLFASLHRSRKVALLNSIL